MIQKMCIIFIIIQIKLKTARLVKIKNIVLEFFIIQLYIFV